ncbi:MAG: hypothetical protein C0501_20235 [Isosphaera sp.]|nr:hypothetical protein [Isosphaera sp.]
MRTPDPAYLSAALAAAEAPCVSIYVPVGKVDSGGEPAQTRYRSLVRTAEQALEKSYPGPAARDLVAKLTDLVSDPAVWADPGGAVVVLASPGRLDAFNLPREVPPRVEVGETFHVKPLLRYVQSADPFHVLGVSRERVGLFEGNRYGLRALHVPGVPLTLAEARGAETDEPLAGSTAGGPGPGPKPGTRDATDTGREGRGSREEQLFPDIRRFFQIVDRAVTARVSEPSGLPVILAGIDDNLSEFRAATKNRFVVEEAVHGDWTNLSLPEIRDRAWKVFEKHYLDRLAQIREDFGLARSRGKGTADLAEAARAAAEGRIGTLLIDADRVLPGSVERGTGEMRPASAGDPAAGDMLDDLAEMALLTKARVILTPSANVPTDTGLAAIYRY